MAGRQQGKTPPVANAETLRRAAERYVARYASSAEQLRRVLNRRVLRSAHEHDTDPEEGARIADEIVSRYVRLGILDDAAFARGRTAALFRRGASAGAIRGRLTQQGLEAEDIENAIRHLLAETPEIDTVPDMDRAAAVSYARRSRLGPFRRKPVDADQRQREMARLARRGFSYEVAKWIIDAETEDDLTD